MTGAKKLLHVGCGPRKANNVPDAFCGPEWQELRLDINPEVEPDYLADICDMGIVPTESVDAIWSSHNIEHLYPHDVPRAVAEFYRVLKYGGILALATPDMQRIAPFVTLGALEAPLYISPMGPISAIDMMYGHRASMAEGNVFMAHRMAFTAHTLANYFSKAGFSGISVARADYELQATAYKLLHPSLLDKECKIVDKGGPSPIV